MDSTQIDLEKIIFSVEPIDSIQNEIIPLLETHWEEHEWKKSAPMKPDWDRYKMLESVGGLAILTARDEGLIGYNVFFIHESLHYKGKRIAVQDLIYIKPEKRGFGKYFIHWCNDKLREFECSEVFYHVKAKNDFGDKLLIPQGFELIDRVYGKDLNGV